MHPQIWEENGGASYSPNVAYLARGGGGAVVEWGPRRQEQGRRCRRSYGLVCLIVQKIQ